MEGKKNLMCHIKNNWGTEVFLLFQDHWRVELLQHLTIWAVILKYLWGTEAEHNKKSCACVNSLLGNLWAKQMQAKECLLLLKTLQKGYEEEID